MNGAFSLTQRNKQGSAEPIGLKRLIISLLFRKAIDAAIPTAEIIAAWFLNQIPDCECIRVYENDDCWAEVTP